MLCTFPDRLVQDIQTGASICLSGQAGQLFGHVLLFGYLSKMTLPTARAAQEWSTAAVQFTSYSWLHGSEPLVAMH